MIKRYLERSSIYVLAIYASIFIFLTYTCAYAFRKPFTAGLYEGEMLWGFDVKLLYVLAEIVGYACSKFIGVRLLPGMKRSQRAWYAIGLMSFSELALLGFGAFPPEAKVFMIFLSGLPLGMIWGILFSFVEGRRISEILNVGLSVALIVSSGIVKTLGQSIMDILHVSEYWMPAVTGGFCFPVMLVCVYMVSQIPNPSEQDIAMRTERLPMTHAECINFLRRFLPGIVLLVVFYGALTVFRELRDSFASDIWNELHVEGAFVFTQTEIPISLVVLVLMLSLSFVKSNRWAVNSIYVCAMLGGGLLVLSTWAYGKGWVSPVWWMVLSGLGMYMGYIPFSFLLDRLIASLKVVSTMVFLLYLADSAGYLGTVVVFLIKNFSDLDVSWTEMVMYTAYVVGGIAMVFIYLIFRYFRKQIMLVVQRDNYKREE